MHRVIPRFVSHQPLAIAPPDEVGWSLRNELLKQVELEDARKWAEEPDGELVPDLTPRDKIKIDLSFLIP